MEHKIKDYTRIKGWGVDADPENDPTYPLKNRTNEEHKGYSWERPPQQVVNMEILKSVERPNVSAVFGTSMPPSGLSGKLRRFAYQWSENTYTRWLTLIFADRVNEYEGIVEDIKSGNIPNLFAEKGWKAEWRLKPERLAIKIGTTAAIVTALLTVMIRKSK
ncbi:hypothetical protein KI659_01440 [Litoribacter alkaliphilus]|uniref:Uncharacterized protein n=1 Tax=Litoribacter ruber TaxID=702568 RepID=A0AAP2G2T2_9BACT|nr:hypothetical protein [Litoribacter alkaliphilus]MBS9522665.1 hypothetical protein [Litoribacter alkaliphilus]